jgi:DNA-binding MarR family transcriptional regulator
MDRGDALEGLDAALTELAKLYQFRSLDQPLYGQLTVSQNYCLRSLHGREPQSMGALASELRVRLSTMTGIVDQLEGKGLVERTAHPEDRRSLQVRLTSKGRRLYRAAHRAFLSHLAPLVDRRTPSEIARMQSFLAEITRTIDGWRQEPRRRRGRARKAHP